MENTQNFLDEIESLFEGFEYSPTQRELIDGQSRFVTWDFSSGSLANHDSLEILQITDVQFGHKQCREEVLQEYLAWVLSEENRFIVLGGDLVDAGHKTSKGSPFEQIGDPQTEVWRLCKLLAPVRHRILGYVGGNHERRSIDQFGDLGRGIAMILRLPYSPGNQRINIHFGNHKPFKIAMHHGNGGGQTLGSITSNLERFTFKGDANWYLLGHLHTPVTILKCRETTDETGVKCTKVIGSRGSSFLGYYGTYAEVIMNSSPQLIAMPLARLERSGKWSVELR